MLASFYLTSFSFIALFLFGIVLWLICETISWVTKSITSLAKIKMSAKQNEAIKKQENLDKDYEATLPGNNACTTDYYKVGDKVPDRFRQPDKFKGYGKKDLHPMYITSSNEYGCRQPTVHAMPQAFHAKSQKFSEHLGTCGMYRNHSLNTAVDNNPVSSQLDGLFYYK